MLILLRSENTLLVLSTSSRLVDVVTEGIRETIKKQRFNGRRKEDDEKVD